MLNFIRLGFVQDSIAEVWVDIPKPIDSSTFDMTSMQLVWCERSTLGWVQLTVCNVTKITTKIGIKWQGKV